MSRHTFSFLIYVEDGINEYGGQIFIYVKIVMEEGKKKYYMKSRGGDTESGKTISKTPREMKVSQGLIKLRVRIYLKTISVHTNSITVKFTSKESNKNMRTEVLILEVTQIKVKHNGDIHVLLYDV